jgi:enoyl-CoA hydratase/carnithine racemase
VFGESNSVSPFVRDAAVEDARSIAQIHVDADEALRIGLVTRIAEDPHAAARELADEIAAKSPDAVRRAKRLLNESARARSEESLALEESLQRELLGSPNQIAAVTAAMTKEPAEFADPE